jgi:hypothetical protein
VVYVPEPVKVTVTVIVSSFVLPALSVARARIVVLPALVTTSEENATQDSQPTTGALDVTNTTSPNADSDIEIEEEAALLSSEAASMTLT